MRLGGRAVVVGAIAVAVLGCDDSNQQPSSSDGRSTTAGSVTSPENDPSSAEAACRAVLPEGYEFLSAQPTTVGEVRALPGGPAPSTPQPGILADAFPGVGRDEFAAWCWGSDEQQGVFLAYVAGPNGTVHTIGTLGSEEPPPPGPPMIE